MYPLYIQFIPNIVFIIYVFIIFIKFIISWFMSIDAYTCAYCNLYYCRQLLTLIIKLWMVHTINHILIITVFILFRITGKGSIYNGICDTAAVGREGTPSRVTTATKTTNSGSTYCQCQENGKPKCSVDSLSTSCVTIGNKRW